MAAFSTFSFFFFFALVACSGCAAACYTAVFGFGDSITDAGNLIHLQTDGNVPHMYFSPYGETFFGHPTGRCSNGRVILDFIAQHYGLPLPPASLSQKDGKKGINFGVVGSRAVDAEFYMKMGIYDTITNISMTDQLNWFQQALPSLCNSPSDCKRVMEESLFVLGEFGGNDYTHALLSGKDINVITTFTPHVTQTIARAVQRLLELGARTVMVPSVLPLGCAASYLTYYPSPKAEDYDEWGCLIWANDMAYHHNNLLQEQLHHLRRLHPYANIVYADLFHAAMQIYVAPSNSGFSAGALRACCGGGGPYNFNPSVQCGNEGATSCEDPSLYVNWDGYHLTETAYSFITNGLLDGPYTSPRMDTLCPSNPQLAQV
ncbi:unnamed protein product [Cuscuta epithymum]|uniref:GDSL esterase/lipase n=1 Tax=Cuscuta epithymum TaxID=186058 RepID=A0AAV0EM87_9ASTE|nr:unnamed protein product [Cuscuta epithymum]CAH9123660.1 unnamed protein product [Cuscuta epithymum]